MSDPHADDPLPPGWSRGYSKSQKRHFYFHSDTKHTQWHFPTASEAKDPQKAKERAEMNKKREFEQHGHHHQQQQQQQQQGDAKRPRVGSSASASSNNSYKKTAATASSAASASAAPENDFLELADATSVAIIVPFRDIHPAQNRAQHLRQFVPHMIKFLSKLKKDGLVSNYHVYIVEQSDDGLKFNRGKLLNIGFDVARKKTKKDRHDVFIFHDVDLLPQPDLAAWYSKFPKTPIHIARVWDRYSNNPKYFGGVVSFSKSDYQRINGYPNNFWGWGGEDDETQRRLARLGIQFESPSSGTLVDLEQMTLTEKLDFLRSNKSWKCMVKWELQEEHAATWKTNGLADLKYTILETKSLDESGKATKITVDLKLNGDHWTNEKAGIDYVADFKKK